MTDQPILRITDFFYPNVTLKMQESRNYDALRVRVTDDADVAGITLGRPSAMALRDYLDLWLNDRI